jgi:hypothetical protein
MLVVRDPVGLGATTRNGSIVSNSARRVGKAKRRWWMGELWKRGT